MSIRAWVLISVWNVQWHDLNFLCNLIHHAEWKYNMHANVASREEVKPLWCMKNLVVPFCVKWRFYWRIEIWIKRNKKHFIFTKAFVLPELAALNTCYGGGISIFIKGCCLNHPRENLLLTEILGSPFMGSWFWTVFLFVCFWVTFSQNFL